MSYHISTKVLIDLPRLFVGWHSDIDWRWWWPPTHEAGITSICIGKLEIAWGERWEYEGHR